MRVKHPIQEFMGVRYYWKPSGYYKAQQKHGGEYMHRAVWRHHHGEIPAGYVVHHRDHDRSRNVDENLALMSESEHGSYHGRVRAAADPEGARAHMAVIRPLASAWHGSPEGLEWHRQHGADVAAGVPMVSHQCVRCGRDYEAKQGSRKRGYCSPACQSAARRASGVDNEERRCVICTAPFTINRYAKTRTCGSACMRLSVSATKRARLRPDG